MYNTLSSIGKKYRHKVTLVLETNHLKCVVSCIILYESLEVRKRICATTCYLNPSEKDCFLAKMSEISGFDAIIFRIFKYIAFR